MFQRLILKVSNEQGSNYGSTAPAQKILPRFKAEARKVAVGTSYMIIIMYLNIIIMSYYILL